MSKYIDVEIAKECFDPSDLDGDCFDNYDNVIRILNTVQAENVAPIIYGEWIYREEWFDDEEKPRMAWGCNKCGFSLKNSHDKRGFCPNCGAKMEESEEKQ